MSEITNRFERYYQANGLRIHAMVWEHPHSDAIPLMILHGLWESLFTSPGTSLHLLPG
jgi:hypothetical protein